MEASANQLGLLFLILMLSINGEAVEESQFDGMTYLESHGISPNVERMMQVLAPADEAEAKEWVRRLGSSIYMLRKDGEKNLVQQGRSAIPVLKKYGLTSDKKAIRKRSAEIIAEIRRQFPEEHLLWRAAVQVLGSVKYSGAVPRLLELLNDDDPSIRAEVVKALARINDPETAGKLAGILEASAEKDAVRGSLAESIRAYCILAKDEELARVVSLLGKDSFESDLVILETLTKRAPAGDWAGAIVKAASGERAFLREGGSGPPVAFARETLRRLYGIGHGKKVSWGETLKRQPAAYKEMSGDQLKALRESFSEGLKRLGTGVRYFSLLSYLDSEGISGMAGVDADMLYNSMLGAALRNVISGNADLKALRKDLLSLTGDYRIDRIVAVISRDYGSEGGYAGLLLEGFFDSAKLESALSELYGEGNAQSYREARIFGFSPGGKSPLGVSVSIVDSGHMAIFIGTDGNKGVRMAVDALLDRIKRRDNPGKMLHPSMMSGVAWYFAKKQPDFAKLLKDVPVLSTLSSLERVHLQFLLDDGKPVLEMTVKDGGKDVAEKLRAIFDGEKAPLKGLAAKVEFKDSGAGRIGLAPEALEKRVAAAIETFLEARTRQGRVGILKMRAGKTEKTIANLSEEVKKDREYVARLQQLITRFKNNPLFPQGPQLENRLKEKKADLAKKEEHLEKLKQKLEAIRKEIAGERKQGEQH